MSSQPKPSKLPNVAQVKISSTINARRNVCPMDIQCYISPKSESSSSEEVDVEEPVKERQETDPKADCPPQGGLWKVTLSNLKIAPGCEIASDSLCSFALAGGSSSKAKQHRSEKFKLSDFQTFEAQVGVDSYKYMSIVLKNESGKYIGGGGVGVDLSKSSFSSTLSLSYSKGRGSRNIHISIHATGTKVPTKHWSETYVDVKTIVKDPITAWVSDNWGHILMLKLDTKRSYDGWMNTEKIPGTKVDKWVPTNNITSGAVLCGFGSWNQHPLVEWLDHFEFTKKLAPFGNWKTDLKMSVECGLLEDKFSMELYYNGKKLPQTFPKDYDTWKQSPELKEAYKNEFERLMTTFVCLEHSLVYFILSEEPCAQTKDGQHHRITGTHSGVFSLTREHAEALKSKVSPSQTVSWRK